MSDIEVTDVVIRANAHAFDSLRYIREQVEESMERLAEPLEQAAHRIFKARTSGQRYTRAGQYPSLESVNLLIGTANFKVSNGRDPGDDFTHQFLVKDLEAAYREMTAHEA